MNLKTHIRKPLWLAISNSYEANNYTHSIEDAMHYLSDVLREKSGVDGDGHKLVGQALGGISPILRINLLQTESERDVQRGMEQLLRGLYLAIRNPRSHELADKIEDTRDTADAIIFFINHMLEILDESSESFTIPGFLERVLDPDFFPSERYAELLVDEIPINKQLDTLIEIFRNKLLGEGNNIRYVVFDLINRLNDNQKQEFLALVSQELKTTKEDEEIRLTLQIIPPDYWPEIEEVSRLRIENKLIRSIQRGKADYNGECLSGAGALGTWSKGFLIYFTHTSEIRSAITKKLNGDIWEQLYVFHHYLRIVPTIYSVKWLREQCVSSIAKAINENEDDLFRQQLVNVFFDYPDEWKESFRKALPGLEADFEEIPF